MSTQADKVIGIAQQLVGDIGRLPGVVLNSGAEAQLVQLITDAFEQVGGVALEGFPDYVGIHDVGKRVPPYRGTTAEPDLASAERD